MSFCDTTARGASNPEMKTSRRYRMRTLFLAISLLLTASMPALFGQATDPNQQAANAAYQAKDWAKSATLYGSLVQTEPKNFRFWYRLGTSEQNLGQQQKALEALEQARA